MLENLMAWFVANPTASFENGTTFQDKDSKGGRESKKGELAA
jgi:hypothetical protein